MVDSEHWSGPLFYSSETARWVTCALCGDRWRGWFVFAFQNQTFGSSDMICSCNILQTASSIHWTFFCFQTNKNVEGSWHKTPVSCLPFAQSKSWIFYTCWFAMFMFIKVDFETAFSIGGTFFSYRQSCCCNLQKGHMKVVHLLWCTPSSVQCPHYFHIDSTWSSSGLHFLTLFLFIFSKLRATLVRDQHFIHLI